jgi:hypothetical protein
LRVSVTFLVFFSFALSDVLCAVFGIDEDRGDQRHVAVSISDVISVIDPNDEQADDRGRLRSRAK